MPGTDKIKANHAPLEKILHDSKRPLGAIEIAQKVANLYGKAPDNAKEIREAVNMASVSKVLGDLAESGTARELRGHEMTPFYDRRPDGRYWVHRAHVGRWLPTEQDLAAEARREASTPEGAFARMFFDTTPETAEPAKTQPAHDSAAPNRRTADAPTEEYTWFNVMRGLEKLPFSHVGISHEQAEENKADPETAEDGTWWVAVEAPLAVRSHLSHRVVMEALALMTVGFDLHRGHVEPPVYSASITDELMDAVTGEGTWSLSMEAGAAIVLHILYGPVVGPRMLRRILPDVA